MKIYIAHIYLHMQVKQLNTINLFVMLCHVSRQVSRPVLMMSTAFWHSLRECHLLTANLWLAKRIHIIRNWRQLKFDSHNISFISVWFYSRHRIMISPHSIRCVPVHAHIPIPIPISIPISSDSGYYNNPKIRFASLKLLCFLIIWNVIFCCCKQSNRIELRNNWRNAFRLSESGIYRINLVS